MDRHPHILNASCSLLGICFVIIGALKLANANPRSYADETTWVAAACFIVSIMASYGAIRSGVRNSWLNTVADSAFLSAIFLLALAMVIAAIYL